MNPAPRQRKLSPLPLIATAEEKETPQFQSSHPALLSYDEIPEWYQDNEFIHNGYRLVSHSTHACFASLLYLHNETVNIYSHLIPGALFLSAEGIVYLYFQDRYPDATIGDHLIFAFFLLTAATCLGLSASYHTLMNHSRDVCNLWLQLDFVGIIILTLGDFVSGIDMVFYCEPGLKRVYWTMVCIEIFSEGARSN
jgi:adiponectin receptor